MLAYAISLALFTSLLLFGGMTLPSSNPIPFLAFMGTLVNLVAMLRLAIGGA